jgi:hypothetical protein
MSFVYFFDLPSDGALSTELIYIFLAPLLHSDWFNFVFQGNLKEKLSHMEENYIICLHFLSTFRWYTKHLNLYIFLALPLHSDCLNYAVQVHLVEKVGHLFTCFDLPLDGAPNSEMIYISLDPPFVLIGYSVPFLRDTGSSVTLLPNLKLKARSRGFSCILQDTG